MMMNKHLGVLLLGSISYASAAPHSKNLRRQLITSLPNPCDNTLLQGPCTASIAEFFDTGELGATLFCETPDHHFLEVPCVSQEWVNNQRNLGNLNSGITQLEFDGVTVDENCAILCDDPPTLVNPGPIPPKDACETGAVSGTRSVLVVRVEYTGLNSPYSQAEFSDSVFGTAGDRVNLRTQTAACSHNFLNFEASTYDPVRITDGAITIRIPDDTMINSLTFQNAVTRELSELFNTPVTDLADHIMYCMPENVMSAIAFGFINSWVSVHKPEWCRRVSTAFHEIFHNVGLGHANDLNYLYYPGTNVEYDDMTGYMGYGYSGDDHPQMCFNAANTYQLGWFCDKTVTCVPSPCNSCQIELGGFVDYANPSVENVLVRIEQPNGDFFYMTYNAKKGFNWQVVEGGNKVIINRQQKEGLLGDFTFLEAIMGPGDSYVINNFEGVPGEQVIVSVDSIVNDIASITISVPAPCNTENNPGSRGDPHFKTWKNEHFEYHGQCDLVLTKDPEFANGLGIDVHIRTKLVRYWSYIKSIAIRIGNDILEVQGGDDNDTTHYWINYEYRGELETLGGFPIVFNEGGSIKRIFQIDLDSVYPGQKILIGHFKEFVSVEFANANEASFGNSVGLLGNFSTGQTLARDGVTVLDDFTELGNAWQVLPSDPTLFREASSPQFPNKCLEPEDPRGDRRRRHLGESALSERDAEEACAGLQDPMDRKDCVYDILATQDLSMVGAY